MTTKTSLTTDDHVPTIHPPEAETAIAVPGALVCIVRGRPLGLLDVPHELAAYDADRDQLPYWIEQSTFLTPLELFYGSNLDDAQRRELNTAIAAHVWNADGMETAPAYRRPIEIAGVARVTRHGAIEFDAVRVVAL